MKLSQKDSELRYRRLFEAAQDGILILDARTGMIEDVNPYLIKMLGYSREEFVAKKLWEVGAFKDIKASKDAFEALREKEYIRYEDLPLKTKDGRLIEVEFISNVYLAGNEKVIQCNIREISEHKRIVAALQANEKKYYDLINQSPDGYFIIELSGNILVVNKAMCKELEFSEEEFLSMSIWDIIPEPFLDQYREALTKILKGESWKEAAEYEVRGQDGKTHYVEVLSAPRYSGKDIIGFQGIARDITARKRAEDALRVSEERFRIRTENSSDLITVVGLDGTIQYESASIEHLLGYKPEELVGTNSFDMTHPDDRQRVMETFAQNIQKAGSATSAEFRLRHRDGSWRVFEGLGKAYLNEQGQMTGLINSRDITERKQGEEALRASESKFRSYNEYAPLGVFVADQYGRYVEVNAAATRMLGYTESELLQLSIPDVLAPQSLEAGVQQFQKVMRDGSASGEKLFRRQDGTHFWVIVLAVRLSEDRFMSYCQDITERKEAEEQILSISRFPIENPYPVLRLGSDGSILYANDAGMYFLDFQIDHKVTDEWQEHVTEVLASGLTKEIEIDFAERTFSCILIPIQDAGYVNVYGRDVTERKRAEEEIKKQLDELQRWHNATLGRENRILDLKRELNELLRQLGQPPRYPSAET